MRPTTRVGFLLALCTTVAACSSVQVRIRYDRRASFAAYRSFDWVPRPEDSNPAADVVPGFRQRVMAAVETSLAKKGVQRVSAGASPDFHVVYYTHMKFETHQWVSTWGYPYGSAYGPRSYGAWGYSANPWFTSMGPNVSVEQWQVGVIVIDLVDAKSRKLVWRGWGQGLSDPNAPDKELLEVVRAIIARFPPSAKR